MSLHDPSKVFFTICFAFCTGILVSTAVSSSFLFFLFACSIAVVYGYIYYRLEKKRAVIAGILVLLALCCGGLRLKLSEQSTLHTNPGKVLVGTVSSNPTTTSYGQSFLFTTDTRRVLIRNRSQEILSYNDTTRLSGTCKEPENFETDLGNTFNYKAYLKKDHVYYICDIRQADHVVSRPSILGYLYSVSDMFAQQIQSIFKTPHDAFVGGVLVGDKTTIPSEVRNDFIKTGTIHMLALSGYNIAIVALFFQYIFALFFRKKYALLFGGVAVVLFVAMTGFSASAIRAGLMALIVIYASWTYQKYSPTRALVFVSFLMILYDPFFLVYDTSFHLSFLATYGVVALSPLCELFLTSIKNKLIRMTIATTIGAYCMTLPYTLYFFQGISLVGIFANVVVLPMIPLFMLLSTIALGISFVSVPLAFVSVWCTESFSRMILGIVHFFASIPFGYLTVVVPWWICLALYGCIFGIMYSFRKKVDL